MVDPLPGRLLLLEQYARLKAARDLCVGGMIESALHRSTGYDVTSIKETAVHWASENSKIWFPTPQSDCPPEPVPPGEYKPP